MRDKITSVFFCTLFALLALVYLPSFFDPPRSDHWATFYFFHRVNILPGIHRWLYIMNFDPWTQARFYPLAYLIVYFKHLVAGTNFVYDHIFHFIIYCISILLLYKLAMKFCKNKILAAVFLGIFAFLFSHFDIISWSFLANIVFGFCLFLLGFILYITYLRSGSTILLFFVMLCFLFGSFCCESFILWPLGIIILSCIDAADKGHIHKSDKLKAALSVIITVYIFYSAIFFLSQNVTDFEKPLFSMHNFSTHLNILNIIKISFSIFFSILYNNILVNAMPLIACPIKIEGETGNILLGGFLTAINECAIEKMVFIGGGLSILFLLVISYLLWRKCANAMKIIGFFVYLLFSYLFIIFLLRSYTNSTIYNLTQFRYQYVPNALIILIVLILIDNFLKGPKRKKNMLYAILAVIFLLNIYASRHYVSFINNQLKPLSRLLADIKVAIKSRQINPENKLYIDDNIAEKLPYLCWNREMGKFFMKGTYQWIFSKKEINCFSFSLKEAAWVIDEDDFSIVRK